MTNITEVIDVILERQNCLEPSDTARDAVAALTEAGYAIVPVCQHFSKDPILYEVNVYFENTQEMDAFFEAMKASVSDTGGSDDNS